jgi:head-tail adaptor
MPLYRATNINNTPSFGNVSAGQLDEIMHIQRRVNTRTPGMDVKNEWQTIFENVWFERNPKNGREMFGADQIVGSLRCIFKTRYMPDIRQADRCVIGREIWEIIDVQPVGRQEALYIFVDKFDNNSTLTDQSNGSNSGS